MIIKFITCLIIATVFETVKNLKVNLLFQFVEIKGTLFKRIDVNNLLQISCSDVKERFHLSVLLFVVFMRNMTEFNWDLGK